MARGKKKNKGMARGKKKIKAWQKATEGEAQKNGRHGRRQGKKYKSMVKCKEKNIRWWSQ